MSMSVTMPRRGRSAADRLVTRFESPADNAAPTRRRGNDHARIKGGESQAHDRTDRGKYRC